MIRPITWARKVSTCLRTCHEKASCASVALSLSELMEEAVMERGLDMGRRGGSGEELMDGKRRIIVNSGS